MKPCLLLEDPPRELNLMERLKENLEIVPVMISDLSYYDLHGQYLIIPGVSLLQLDKTAQENLLRRQFDLLVIPPFPHDDLSIYVATLNIFKLETAGYSSSKVVDDVFTSGIGQEKLDIFFQKVVRAVPCKPLLVTDTGRPLLVYTQAHSTWGRLLVTSLLLTSLSARTNESHKALFWRGLSHWLEVNAPVPLQTREVSYQKLFDEDAHLPLLLMAAQIARKEESLSKEDFQQALAQIKIKLHQGQVEIDLNGAIKRLVDLQILSISSEGGWLVDPEILSMNINQMHLGSYIRRLM